MSNAKPKAGVAAPAEPAPVVHTSAQPAAAATTTAGCTGCGSCGVGCDKPKAHQPTPPRPRDAYAGVAGTFVRDPITGERRPLAPATVEKE